MLAPTVVRKLKDVLVTGSACVAEPPIAVRSQDTAKLADEGFCPGVIVPLSVVCSPGPAGLGEAEPVAVGLIEMLLVPTVMVTSSIAIPSSLPLVSLSVQRIQKLWPSGIVRPLIVALINCRQFP